VNRSYITALVITAAVFLWLASGWLSYQKVSELAESPNFRGESALMQVRTRDLSAQDKKSELIVLGRTKAKRTVILRAETAGTVIAISIDKGLTSKKDTVIVQLAQDDRPAQMKEAQAVVNHASIAYEAAKQLSKKAFRSKVQLAENKAKLESARAKRAAIQLDINKTQIRTPFSGIINDVSVEIGDYLKVGDNVATLIDLDPMLLVAEIAERNIGRIKVGGLARVKIIGLGSFDGIVSFVSRTAALGTRTFRVEVSVSNLDGVIGEGMTSELTLILGVVRAHLISPAILTLSDEGVVGIKIVNEVDVVEFHPVNIIADSPSGMWVNGLGSRIKAVTVGQEFVKTGQKVRPISEKAPLIKVERN